MITDFLAEGTPRLHFSSAESARFGMTVARLSVPVTEQVSTSQLDEILERSAAGLVVLRCETQSPEICEWLANLDTWRHLHADTLLYFSRQLDDIPCHIEQDLRGDVVDQALLHELAAVTFASYRNHYSSNPRLPQSAVRDGYSEWLSTLLSDSATRAFIVDEAGMYVSFVVASELPSLKSGEIVLNGTHPDHESRGHYSRLVERTLRSFKSTGAEKVWISTQASNRRVIRAWIRLGFNFEHAFDTYHLTPKSSAHGT